jgi:hypothetical protein
MSIVVVLSPELEALLHIRYGTQQTLGENSGESDAT